MTWTDIFSRPYTLRDIYNFRLECDPSNAEFYLQKLQDIADGRLENKMFFDY